MEAEYSIAPLQPGERRPDGYYLVNHFTGRSPYPAGAVEVEGHIRVLRAAPQRASRLRRPTAFITAYRIKPEV